MPRLFGDDSDLTAPVERDCITCHLPLSRKRLDAVPDAVQCIKCICTAGDEPKIRGRMVWSHKTAPDIEIGTQLAATPQSNAYGPSFRLDKFARVQDAAQLPFGASTDNPCAIGAELKPGREAEPVIVAVLLKNPARCHPDRPRIGPSGYCLPCAIAQQERRVKHAH